MWKEQRKCGHFQNRFRGNLGIKYSESLMDMIMDDALWPVYFASLFKHDDIVKHFSMPNRFIRRLSR
jgi:hypothetical protein